METRRPNTISMSELSKIQTPEDLKHYLTLRSGRWARFGDRVTSIIRPLKKLGERVGSRLGAFTGLISPGSFDPCFERIIQYSRIDGLVNLSFLRHVEQIINAGWIFRGTNRRAINYVQDRLHEMGQRMAEPYEVIISGIVWDVVKFSNSLLYLNRNQDLSPGLPLPFERGNRSLPPIVAVENLPITEFLPEVDRDTRRIARWRRRGSFQLSSFTVPWRNMVHTFVDRLPGEVYGTPWVKPVLDDIQDLRAIEAVISTIIQQQGAPLIHVKITNPIIDLEGNSSEVLTVRDAIAAGDLSGGFYVSDDRITIEPVSNQAAVENFKWVAGHYKERGREGLNLSTIDLGTGDTSNRNTASSLTDKGVARCKFMALIIEWFINFYLIEPLLLEGGYRWTFGNDSNLVRFQFNEIDIDHGTR